MATPIYNPKVYCGPHDFVCAHMHWEFGTFVNLYSYRDFPNTFKDLATDKEMDDYLGMHLMGGEL